MLTEPCEVKKTWGPLMEIVKETHRKVIEIMNKPSFSFKLVDLHDKNGTSNSLRGYCLGSINDNMESTLLYCDIQKEKFSAAGIIQDNNGSDSIVSDLDELDSPVFEWKELVEFGMNKDDNFNEKLSHEEKLQLERKRMNVSGIVAYEFHEQKRRFVFSYNESLNYFDDYGVPPYVPIKLPSNITSAKINPAFCPHNPDLIAYVSDKNIFVLNIKTGKEIQLTNVKQKGAGSVITAGLPSYIVQEEFSRYVGFWWRPKCKKILNSSIENYDILYEEVDETDIDVFKISSWDGKIEEYRYPKPGCKNAKSNLRIASFSINTQNDEFLNISDNVLPHVNDLKNIYPTYEYLVRCKWVSNDAIVVQLLERKQKVLAVILISLSNSFPPQIILEEVEETYWVYITDILEFLNISNEDKDDELLPKLEISFLWASRKSGFRHLYHYKVQLVDSKDESNVCKSCLIYEKQLTSGSWEVSDEGVWVDLKNSLIYFIGCKDSPLERHLYVISFKDEQCENKINKLTYAGYSNSIVVFNSNHTYFINIQSNLSKPPFGFLNSLQLLDSNLPSVEKLGYVIRNKIIRQDSTVVDCIKQLEMLPGFSRPSLFSYKLKDSGDIVYGLIYKPDFLQANKKYPVVLEIYGGPSVQLITNNFRSGRLLRRHILASQGYVVCVLDCRGSNNRGIEFEGFLNERLGQVEVNDQVEVLQWLASTTKYIDLNRVAVHGWSYGGYLSLMCYAQRPDIFKIAIAGAPVTNWLLYDTGYTERYLGLPSENEFGYAKGSVLNYVKNFPVDQNRLLIIHGLMDENVHFEHTTELIQELVKNGKPYSLQVFPNERHSIRSLPSCAFYETILLSFLNQNL